MVCGVVTVILITKKSRNGDVSSKGTERNERQGSLSQQREAAGENPAAAPGAGQAAASDASAGANKNAAPLSQAAQKRTIVTASGVRKELIDPMAGWEDLPPWPEGLRLYAQVETADKRYVNLRPDDVGELPRVEAEAEEMMEITVSIPEADPGEKLYVELPNGGRFPDQEAVGRMVFLGSNRTVPLKIITDESRGHCNVKIIHRGQTRSLPIWVGAPRTP